MPGRPDRRRTSSIIPHDPRDRHHRARGRPTGVGQTAPMTSSSPPSQSAPVLLDVVDSVATITLNRPEAMNGLDVATESTTSRSTGVRAPCGADHVGHEG